MTEQKTAFANLEAERAVLGAMLIDALAVEEAADLLGPEDFYLEGHRVLFECATAAYSAGAIEPGLVLSEVMRRGVTEQCGGAGYILTLPESIASTANTVYYARIVRDRSLRRQQREFAATVAQAAEDLERPAVDVQADLEGALLLLGSDRSIDITNHAAAADALLREGATGMPFHLSSLTRADVKMSRGLYTAVGGVRKAGKSRFGLGEIRHKCKQGIPVCMFSLEMTGPQLYVAMYAQELGIPLPELKAGVQSKNAPWFPARYERVVAAAASWPLWVVARPGLTVQQMSHRARRFKRHYKGEGLIVIDYAQRIRANGKDERERLATGAHDLADMAKSLDMPVLLLMQTTEQTYASAKGDAGADFPAAHSRGSLEYEIAAESVILLDRPSKRLKPDDTEGHAQWDGRARLNIVAGRNTPDAGCLIVGWREGVGEFCDLAQDEEPRRSLREIAAEPEYEYGDPFAED